MKPELLIHTRLKAKCSALLISICLLFSLTARGTTHHPLLFLSAEGAFVEQMYNDTGYAILDLGTNRFPFSPIGELRYINPRHKLSAGFGLGIFLTPRSDIQLHFFAHNHLYSDSISASPGTRLSTPLLIRALQLDSLTPIALFAKSSLSANINSFRLLIRYAFSHPSSLLNIHAYTGIDLSRLKVKQFVFYDEVDRPDPIKSVNFEEKSSVTGIGPLVGGDIEYPLSNHFSLLVNADVTFLMGRHVSSSNQRAIV